MSSDLNRGIGDHALTDRFPGAVHSPYRCPACGLLHLAHRLMDPWRCPACGSHVSPHRFAPMGTRRGYRWTRGTTGEIRVRPEGIIIDSPPRKR